MNIVFVLITFIFSIICALVSILLNIKIRQQEKNNTIGELFVKKDPDDGEIYIFMQLENCSPNDVLTMDKVVLTVRHEIVEKATDA